MIDAYQSGDPYLAFAKQAGAVPDDATKETHGAERNRFKTCALGVLYGMGPKILAQRVDCTEFEARELLRLHKQTYKRFWKWSDAVGDYAGLHRKLWTAFGWKINYPGDINPRSVQNFPMQANGAEMLRVACCFATEQGIRVCAPIHDAILIEFDLEDEETAIIAAREAMRDASALVLSGFELRTDVTVVRYPGRYMDDRGKKMWDVVWEIIEQLPLERE
jgi:DNA polymerase I-like protein with 3'-5' exonuclease and polymerase domains